jgi:deoxyribonuclease-1
MKHRLIILLLSTLPLSCTAGQNGQQAFDNYFDALRVFWDEVYPQGGETLYCGTRFGSRKGRDINIEHVLPMAWAMNKENCRSRDECRDTSNRFNQIEADMHNFYPSNKEINKTRGSHSFGYIKGERREFGRCDFEVDRRARIVEPRPASRGNIARAMFYMHDTYGLKIFNRQAKILKQWNREDPPDAEEQRRNDIIAGIQGTRNRFIDDPEAVDQLRF